MTPVAKRLKNLPPYPFAVLNQRVRELQAAGSDIIRLDIGSPDLPPPSAVVETLCDDASNPNLHGYAGYKGTPKFREAVAKYYRQRFGVTVDPETEILPLLGSKEGIVNLSLAFLDQGDIALVPDVSYPAYSLGAGLAGGSVHWLPVSEASGWLPDPSTTPAEVAARARLLWTNYPNNPTGAVADLDFYARMIDYCRERDIVFVSDNPYVDVTFDGYVAPSALQVEGAKDCTIEFVSSSKTYNMAGWRLGAAVGCAEILRALLQVKSNMDSGHFEPIYNAGVTAVDTPPEWIAERNQVYQARRDRIMDCLPHIGLSAEMPKGSLYIWARTDVGDGGRYVEEALLGTSVMFAPGQIYGPGGTPYVRIAITTDDSRLDEALDRLKTWYASR